SPSRSINPERRTGMNRETSIGSDWSDRAVHSRASLDDGLTLYLKQMGSMPRLDRQQEIELVTRLDRARRRYRHAAFCNWGVLARLVETFERIRSGEQNLVRSIDVMASLGLTAEQIGKRLPGHLRRLHRLCEEAALEFKRLLRARARAERS